MTGTDFPEVLVVLNVPPGLDDTIVDWLLAREDNVGFTGFPVFGHSTRHDELSPAEQVAGRQRRQQFQVQLEAGKLDDFLKDARQSLRGTDVHFWVIPLLAGGRFDGPA